MNNSCFLYLNVNNLELYIRLQIIVWNSVQFLRDNLKTIILWMFHVCCFTVEIIFRRYTKKSIIFFSINYHFRLPWAHIIRIYDIELIFDITHSTYWNSINVYKNCIIIINFYSNDHNSHDQNWNISRNNCCMQYTKYTFSYE